MYTQSKRVLLVVFLCLLFLYSGKVNADGNCDNAATVKCDSEYVSPEDFVPNEGTVAIFEDEEGNRYIFLGFKWTNENAISWYGTNDYNTLEPQVNIVGEEPYYTTDFEPPFEWGSGQMFPPKSVIIYSSNYPYPYADALAEDNTPNITVGSARAIDFNIGEIYFTRSKVNKNAPSGKITVSFQRGRWNRVPIRRYLYIIPLCMDELIGAEPDWALAPACIYSCCIEYNVQVNNYHVISPDSPKSVPGCYDWRFQSGVSTVTKCQESLCSDEQDNDWDGLIDCEDPDCSDTPACISTNTDPCHAVTSGNGYYCGQDDEIYNGNFDELYLCVDGVSTVPPAGYPETGFCPYGCFIADPGADAYCLEETCTPICNPGEIRCNGDNIEVCATDQCSFVYSHTCNTNENCINGACILQNASAPVISHVNCNTYERGDIATCTIYGSNFVAGGNTYIEDMENRQILSLSSNQIQIRGTWACVNDLGTKQVSHLNPDGQRDDKYNLLTTVMGELQITAEWPGYVHEGDSGFQVGFNGCNFGQNPVVYVEGVQLTNIHLQAPDQVLATGTVVAESDGTSGDKCVAKYSGATSSFDKKCCYNCITILQ